MRGYRISEFYCSSCGSMTPLPRLRGQQREKYHVKDLWCFKCRDTTAHTEKRFCDHVFVAFHSKEIS